MIKNEHQYRVTRALVDELSHSLRDLDDNVYYRRLPPRAQSAHVSSLKAQIDQSKREMKEYERLKSGKFNFETQPTLEQIPSWLIKARIARGLNQEDLARLLKVKKQQIQHYESTDYSGASLTRIREIADVLRNFDESRYSD